jgi:hypothetical protein
MQKVKKPKAIIWFIYMDIRLSTYTFCIGHEIPVLEDSAEALK